MASQSILGLKVYVERMRNHLEEVATYAETSVVEGGDGVATSAIDDDVVFVKFRKRALAMFILVVGLVRQPPFFFYWS